MSTDAQITDRADAAVTRLLERSEAERIFWMDAAELSLDSLVAERTRERGACGRRYVVTARIWIRVRVGDPHLAWPERQRPA